MKPETCHLFCGSIDIIAIFQFFPLRVYMHTPHLAHAPCHSRVACALLRSQELCRQEPSTPGRSHQAGQVLGGGARRSIHPGPPDQGVWRRVVKSGTEKKSLVTETTTTTSTADCLTVSVHRRV